LPKLYRQRANPIAIFLSIEQRREAFDRCITECDVPVENVVSKLMPPLANEVELEKVAVGDAMLFQL
jgi:hypothetical protein